MIPLSLGHDSCVQLSDLVVLARLALVGPVAPSTDDVRSSLIRCLSDRWTGKVWSGRSRVGRLVAVWEIGRLPTDISVDPHRAPVVVGRVELGQEWTVDGDLVDVGTLQSVILSISVEECSPLQ